MLPQCYISELLKRIAPLSREHRPKHELLIDEFKGQDCYILTCGPSLNQYSIDFLREKLDGKLVLGVKQASSIDHELIDFHFVNGNNYQPIEFKERTPIKVHSMDPRSRIFPGYNLFFEVEQNVNLKRSILYSREFDEYDMRKGQEGFARPWGPGIIFETVFFFAEMLGVKNLYTIGWDSTPNDSSAVKHFYGNTRNVLAPGEAELIRNNSLYFCEWLKERGVNLQVCKDSPEYEIYLNPKIPRVSLK